MNCTECNGDGYITKTEPCLTCNGDGYVEVTSRCPDCEGSGYITGGNCSDCHGSGSVSDEQCGSCGGGGKEEDRRCDRCEVTGQIIRRRDCPKVVEVQVACVPCGGTGNDTGDLLSITEISCPARHTCKDLSPKGGLCNGGKIWIDNNKKWIQKDKHNHNCDVCSNTLKGDWIFEQASIA